MKAIAHLMAKDLRRYWPLLILTTGSIFGFLFLDYRGVRLLLGKYLSGTLADILPQIVTWVLVFLAVAAIVHEDAPANRKSFWLTRPVTPGQLFAAKSLLFFLIIILPSSLGNGVLSISLEADPQTATTLTVEVALITLLLVAVSMFFSSVTTSILKTCALITVSFISFTLFFAVTNLKVRDLIDWLPINENIQISYASKNVASLTLMGVGMLPVIYLHYRYQQLSKTIPALIVTIFLALSAKVYWPIEIVPKPVIFQPAKTPKLTPTQNLEIALQGPAQYMGLFEEITRKKTTHSIVTGYLNLISPAPERIIEISSSQSELVFSDGTKTSFKARKNIYPKPARSIIRALRASLGENVADADSIRYPVQLFSVPETKTALLPAGTTLIDHLQIKESAFVRKGILPLHIGERHKVDNGLLFIDKIIPAEKRLQIQLRTVKATSIFSTKSANRPDGLTANNLLGRSVFYVLYNRRLNDFSIGQMAPRSSGSGGYLSKEYITVNFTARLGADKTRGPADASDTWLSDSELWIMQAVPVSESIYTLTVENFQILSAQPAVPDWAISP